MSEFERPGLGELPPLTRADEDAAVARLRRLRRNRRATRLSVAASVVAVAALVTTSAGAGSPAGIAPAAGATAAQPDEPERRSRPPAPRSQVEDAPSATASPDPTLPPAPVPLPDPTLPPLPLPTASPAEPQPVVLVGYELRKNAAPRECEHEIRADTGTNKDGTPVADDRHWCVGYHGPQRFVVDVGGTFETRFCRGFDGDEKTITRGHNGHLGEGWAAADIAGGRPTQVRLGWSGKVPARSTITFQPGDCATWTWSWRADIPPDEYVIGVSFSAESYRVEHGDWPGKRFPLVVTG